MGPSWTPTPPPLSDHKIFEQPLRHKEQISHDMSLTFDQKIKAEVKILKAHTKLLYIQYILYPQLIIQSKLFCSKFAKFEHSTVSVLKLINSRHYDNIPKYFLTVYCYVNNIFHVMYCYVNRNKLDNAHFYWNFGCKHVVRDIKTRMFNRDLSMRRPYWMHFVLL